MNPGSSATAHFLSRHRRSNSFSQPFATGIRFATTTTMPREIAPSPQYTFRPSAARKFASANWVPPAKEAPPNPERTLYPYDARRGTANGGGPAGSAASDAEGGLVRGG